MTGADVWMTPLGDVAIDPADPSRVFVGMAGAVFVTEDGGETFAPTDLIGESPLAILLPPSEPGRVYVGTWGSAWRSDDSGASFYEAGTGLYTHAATLMICTPDGRLSRYLNNVYFEPETLQLALTEASQGTIGTPVQRILLRWCYTYDPTAGKYVLAARKVMTIGGAVTLVLTAAGLAVLWRREAKRKFVAPPGTPPGNPSAKLASDPHS